MEDAFRAVTVWFRTRQLKENMANVVLQMILGFTLDSEMLDYLMIDEASADGHSRGQVCGLNKIADSIFFDKWFFRDISHAIFADFYPTVDLDISALYPTGKYSTFLIYA
jgi:hypothetical protein